MVSFSCENCNDTVIKKKLDQHAQRCRGAYFTCIDCSVTFNGTEYRNHTQCISEAEKYEKALYKPKKKQQQQPKKVVKEVETKVEKVEVKAKEVEVEVKELKSKKDKDTKPKTKKDLAAYVSDKNANLYKVLKKMASDLESDLKEVLKKLKVVKNAEGEVSISI